MSAVLPQTMPLPLGQIPLTSYIHGDAYPRFAMDTGTGQVYVGNGLNAPTTPIGQLSGVPQDQFDALYALINQVAAATVGAIPFDPTESISAGDQRYFHNGIYEAQVDLPVNCPPMGIGDGSQSDRLLQLSRVTGMATGTDGGGLTGTLVTVHNDNDSGAGSLRQAILDHQAAKIIDPTRKTWIIFDKSHNVDGDGYAVYNITPLSQIMIAGKGSADLTIDCRGVDFTYNGGGTPGAPGVGTHPWPFAIGGSNNYNDGFGDGNTTPSNNIILAGMGFHFNAGGEDGDNGFYDVLDIELWAHHIFLDHCLLTNDDWHTDGNLEIGWGSTWLHQSWCVIGPHDKSELIIDNFPPGHSLPPGVSLAAPGPYSLWTDSTTPLGRVIQFSSQDHCYKPHVGDRAPYAKGNATRYHGWNNWSDRDGFYAGNIADTSTYIYYGTDPTFGGHPVNIGGPFQCGKGGHMLLEGSIVTPYSSTLAGSTGATRGVFSKREGVFGFSKTVDILYEGSKRNDGGDHLPDQVFVPTYAYTPDAANQVLKDRLTAHAGPVAIRNWKYIGPGSVDSSINVQQDGTDIGAGTTAIAAQTVNFAGAGITDVTFDGGSTATVTIDAGLVDPTVFNLVGSVLPTPDVTYVGKRYRLVTASDGNAVPTAGIEYECRHNATLGVYEWEVVAFPVVIPGQVIGGFDFRTAGAMTTATTTATSPADLTTAAIAASWTGVVAASFDMAFTVPPSGKVQVEIDAFVLQSAAGAKVYFDLYDVTNAVHLSNVVEQVMAIQNGTRVSSKHLITGLTPGAALTYRPQWYVSASTGSMVAGGVGGSVRGRVKAAL